MSREIKFRCWDQKDKKYLLPEKQGFVILPTMPSFSVTRPYENCSNPGNIDEDCIDWADADLLMGRYELEQYIALKDKNGKEIYEGDIVKCWSQDTYPIGRVMYSEEWAEYEIVSYDSKDCRVYSLEPFNPMVNKYLEVIGNIHENPELLGGEK